MTTQLPVMPGQIPRKGAEDMTLTMDSGFFVLAAFHLKQVAFTTQPRLSFHPNSQLGNAWHTNMSFGFFWLTFQRTSV